MNRLGMILALLAALALLCGVGFAEADVVSGTVEPAVGEAELSLGEGLWENSLNDGSMETAVPMEMQEWTLDGITYRYREGTMEVLSADAGLVNAVIRSEVEGIPVRRIGTCAFDNLKALKSVKIPDSVTALDAIAFRGCTALKRVSVPASVTEAYWGTFEGCTGLEEITIPATLANGHFAGCDNVRRVTILCDGTDVLDCPVMGGKLESVTILGTVKRLGTFGGKPVLKKVSLPEGLVSISDHAFGDCTALKTVKIPSTVTEVGPYAFQGCTALETMEFPEGLTTVGVGLFDGCTKLKRVKFPGTVTKSDWALFRNCTSLRQATVSAAMLDGGTTYENCKSLQELTVIGTGKAKARPEGPIGDKTSLKKLTFIGSFSRIYGFGSYPKLSSLTIDATVGELSGFSNCPALKKLAIPGSVGKIGENAFADCAGLTSLTVGEGVTSIGDWSFSACYRLKSVSLPQSLKTLGKFAFAECMALTAVDLGGVKTIGASAFELDTSLESVTLPASVKTVRAGAFQNCYGLKRIYIPGSVTSIGKDALKQRASEYSEKLVNIRGLTIYGPEGSCAQKYAKENRFRFVAETIAPKRVAILQGAYAELKAGKKLALTAVVTPTGASTAVTWSSSKASVATVSKAGVVTAKKPGTAKITAKASNGKKAVITIKVIKK